jgi:hypothetical protein
MNVASNECVLVIFFGGSNPYPPFWCHNHDQLFSKPCEFGYLILYANVCNKDSDWL